MDDIAGLISHIQDSPPIVHMTILCFLVRAVWKLDRTIIILGEKVEALHERMNNERTIKHGIGYHVEPEQYHRQSGYNHSRRHKPD